MTVKHITQAAFDLRLKEMCDQQDRALSLVLPHVGTAFDKAKLCGGTALSRFYLKHRISYDLDFFVPTGFDAQAMLNQLARNVPMANLEITHDAIKADQLHFSVDVDGMPIKMSVVEDMYANFFPLIPSGLQFSQSKQWKVMTEDIDGLYHRKLRTVVGWAAPTDAHPSGGRQTARDMFDLFVLSQAHKPLLSFIEQLPFAFAMQAFQEGLANMPWFDLIPELEETVASPRWQSAMDVEHLQNHLFTELGMSVIINPEADDGASLASSAPAARKRSP